MELKPRVFFRSIDHPKIRWPHDHTMIKRACWGLLFCIDSVANRAALHEDHRMMSILAGHSSRKSGDEARLGSAGYQLEANFEAILATR